jgi:ADP-heptose:LPS heptosyltransferase
MAALRVRRVMKCVAHLAAGIGNIVLATPLLVALAELGFTIDVDLDADYPQTADLLEPWSIIRRVHSHPRPTRAMDEYNLLIPAIPPFYWRKLQHRYRSVRPAIARRPMDTLFSTDEQSYYMAFARALGYPAERQPTYQLPIGPPLGECRVGLGTVVIAPGCKTGTMAAKRWPYFPELARRFADVVIVGTPDDLRDRDGRVAAFPPHVRSCVGNLTLRQTAELIAASGVVVANDSGLAHVAGAVGTRTVMLFGPTDDRCLGVLPNNVTVLRAGLSCEPCWTSAPLAACDGRISCLAALSVDRVERAVRDSLNDQIDVFEETAEQC